MRRVLAWVLLVAGLVCALAGAALLTVLAPADRLDVRVAVGQDPGVAVVTAPGLLDLSGPDAHVQATAQGQDVFLAVARAQDVTAWLDQARHTQVEAVTGTLAEPQADTTTTGTGPAVDPRAADIWLTSTTGDGSAALTWATGDDADYRDAGGVVAFAATDGTAAAPGEVELSWRTEGNAATHPSAVPLVVAGGVLAVLGALGLLLTPRRTTPRRRA
ncbi:hypothetical protein [Kineococcus sp. SYSU DK003]|uniref:hypothetical protein n=1 Tax=Kineococcus sp. SYSU DK003 TaxID=3383124 RepID=UPI003D7C6ACB